MGKRPKDQELPQTEQQLRETIRKLQAGEKELMAANQQLAASEEELKTANEQLAASEEELQVANQQLIANEKELKKSQLFANQIANTTPALLYLYDLKQEKNIWTNDAHKDYFKKLTNKYPDLDFNNIAELIHEEDFRKVVAEAQQMNDQPERNQYNLDIRIKSPENGWKWMILRVSTFVRDKEGKLLQTIGALFDITHRKQAELELKKRNEFIQMILDNFPIGIALNEIDSNKTTYINPKFAEIYGWPKEEFPTVIHFFEKVFPDPENRMKMQQEIMADIQSGDPERMNWDNLEITTKNGEKRIVHAYNIPLMDQNTMISTVQDITARKIGEKELQNYREDLEKIVNERTAELIDKNKKLEKFNKLFVGREFRIKELRDTIKELKEKLNDQEES
jgi:PAS domain S-box-containing protein